MGGFFGESKIDILKQINPAYLPRTIFIEKNTDLVAILAKMGAASIFFPVVCKPNVGERGFQVEKVSDETSLKKYLELNQTDFIIQEYVDFPIELGVLYYRMPNEATGQVTSITLKKFLSVTGDGKSSIKELMEQSTRARFQIETMEEKLGKDINEILPEGKEKLLEPIGNHCRGTMFLDNNFLINKQLDKIFDVIALPIEGFHYGRFDMRVSNIEDLYAGKNIRIMELNGVSSEPGHIYDPKNTLWNAYKDLAYHWKIVADICIQQRKKGIYPVPAREIWKVTYQHFFS